MKATIFQRKPLGFGIEKITDKICDNVPQDITCRKYVMKFMSRGIIRRIYNLLDAPFHQGDINHINGDIHYIALLLPKRKTILTIYDIITLEKLSGIKRWLFTLFWFSIPVKKSSYVTVSSESTKNILLKHIQCKAQKIKVIYAPVSPLFQPYLKEFNSSDPTILQVGTNPNNKNLARVAEAAKEISCKLRIIGKLNQEQIRLLEKLNISYSYIYNISEQEVVEEYKKCDMVVFASTYEGFGLPIVEAQAVGRPVVTSNILSMPEVAGDAACVVDPYNVDDIRRGIMKIIEDTDYRSELIRKGLRNVQRFNVEKIAAQYAELYRKAYEENTLKNR